MRRLSAGNIGMVGRLSRITWICNVIMRRWGRHTGSICTVRRWDSISSTMEMHSGASTVRSMHERIQITSMINTWLGRDGLC
jgi:hypothetical protein